MVEVSLDIPPSGFLYSWSPAILRPDYTWPRRMKKISTTTPVTPAVTPPWVRRFWGLVHRLLVWFSKMYMKWFNDPLDWHIYHLPFGLILKWSNRTSIEEAVAMQMVYAAGIPSAKMLCYGEHADSGRPISILMTRLPGADMNGCFYELDADNEGPWLHELKQCVDAMRSWKSPYGESRVCSVIGTVIRTVRVHKHSMGPFETQKELHEYLLSTSSSHSFTSEEEYEDTVATARKIFDMSHRIMFTHGDIAPHNIRISSDGHLAGFIDWESAGWYPEYWDFTTPMRWGGQRSWWYQVMTWLGGDQYLDELKCERALRKLTIDSYVGF